MPLGLKIYFFILRNIETKYNFIRTIILKNPFLYSGSKNITILGGRTKNTFFYGSDYVEAPFKNVFMIRV